MVLLSGKELQIFVNGLELLVGITVVELSERRFAVERILGHDRAGPGPGWIIHPEAEVVAGESRPGSTQVRPFTLKDRNGWFLRYPVARSAAQSTFQPRHGLAHPDLGGIENTPLVILRGTSRRMAETEGQMTRPGGKGRHAGWKPLAHLGLDLPREQFRPPARTQFHPEVIHSVHELCIQRPVLS